MYENACVMQLVSGRQGWPIVAAALRRVPRSVWLASVVQTVFLVALWATDGYDAARTGEWLRLVLTYATVAAIFMVVHFAGRRAPRLAAPLTLFVYTLFVAVNFARFETTGAFDYGFVHENARELMTPLGRSIVTANVKPLEVLFFFALPVAAGIFLLRRPAKAHEPVTPEAARRAAFGLSFVVLAGIPAARMSTHESLTAFAGSAIRFFAQARDAEAAIRGTSFPYVKPFEPSAAARAIAGVAGASGAGAPDGGAGGGAASRPHVIVMFLESWSGRYVDRKRPDGRPFTPTFDARRREGLSFDHFYGNSVQSSRGHFATLCSLVPMYRAKELVDLPDNRYHCLPQVLAEAGYRTVFHSATDEPDFDRSAAFFERIGFAAVRFEDPTTRGQDPAMWGAGLQDDVYYRKFFAALDADLARDPGAPIFAVGANASNHYPFDQRPGHAPAPGFATKYQRNYVASLAAADAWLEIFYAELDKRPALRDAIVVLVGDHSFPADEHGVHFNGLGSYEEAFQTGFSLRWPGHVKPETVADRAASQIDVAPTITDLVGLRYTSHFLGRSLVDAPVGPPPPVPLVQPYDGVRLIALRWPLKLVRHEAAEQEHLYDLSRDPDEKDDRIDDPSFSSQLPALRETIASIHTNQAVLRKNRVWPATPPAPPPHASR